MPITKDQARELAKQFLDLAHALGQFRFKNWGTLSASERRQIEDAEWDLMNHSGSFTTAAVGIALADMQNDLAAITDATDTARKAIETIGTAKDVITLAAALIVLGGAITSKNPSAIVTGAAALLKSAKSVAH